MQVNVIKPVTVYIAFTGTLPRKFELTLNGELFYFRMLDGKTPRIKFNLLHPGTYKGSEAFIVVKMVDVEIPAALPPLPPNERERLKPWRIVFNPRLRGTPARIFTEIGLIETSPEFYRMPKPIRLFILLHEIGHFFYETEEYCDTFALVQYLGMGYNRSMAFYSLSRILKKSNDNISRLKTLLRNIELTNSKKLF